jgi:predicted nucleic acid-binding Zn ribbon protein
MPRRSHDEDDEWDDDWESDEDSGDDDEDDSTVPCPQCGAAIYEDTPRCPSCGRYLSAEDHARTGRPVWVLVTALVCLGMAIWWALSGR